MGLNRHLEGKSSSHDNPSDLLYDGLMRVTLTINDDLAEQIQELRQSHGHSLKRVVNDLLREGLQSRQREPRGETYCTRSYKLSLRPGIDPVKLNQLVDELEDEEWRKR